MVSLKNLIRDLRESMFSGFHSPPGPELGRYYPMSSGFTGQEKDQPSALAFLRMMQRRKRKSGKEREER